MAPQPAFVEVLQGKTRGIPPIWFMRQAGRYLPEYRQTRAQAGSFLNLCFDPVLATEVTLQPIERFDLDAAILFADILLIPMFMGQKLTFETGEGPRLRPALVNEQIDMSIEGMAGHLAPIMETVRRCREQLSRDKALIGFAGAPWTVATYMLAGQGVKDPAGLRNFAYSHPGYFNGLMGQLEEATIEYLLAQVRAGANAIQLFESWAAGLPPDFLREFCLEPAKRIAAAIKTEFPAVPVLAFPKGAGQLLQDYAECGSFDGVSIGTETDPDWAAAALSPHVAVQGGLDPLLVVQGGQAMREAAEKLLSSFAGKAYIFNLGHGFVPHTPPENVAELVEIVRAFK